MKTKYIAIAVGVIILAFVVYSFASNKPIAGAYTSKSNQIPADLQKYLRDFSEGEKMSYEGRMYQVINGAWSIV